MIVTASFCERSSGREHDFYSEGDYWWPDRDNPEGVYIRKDGQSNPDNFSAHRHAMVNFIEVVSTLTSAWLLTSEEVYSNKHLHIHSFTLDSVVCFLDVIFEL